jgi:hypothetical protein
MAASGPFLSAVDTVAPMGLALGRADQYLIVYLRVYLNAVSQRAKLASP